MVSPKPPSEKVWFAHAARGFAASIVVWFHLGENFILRHPVAAQITSSPALDPPPRPFWTSASAWLQAHGLDFGYFGVALFFLISGFVIPFSLDRLRVQGFFLRRVLRIYPLYWLSLAILLGGLWLNGRAAGAPFTYTLPRILANALLIDGYLGFESIDYINWTLAIEELFYIVCALTFVLGLLGRASTLFLLSAALAAYALAAPRLAGLCTSPLAAVFLSRLAHNASFQPFMFVGTAFYHLYRKHWSRPKAALCTGAGLGLFAILAGLGPLAGYGLSRIGTSYGLAFVLFLTLYAYRQRLPNLRALDWLARISYPLYLVHGLNGYMLLFLIGRWSGSYLLALPIAVGLVYLLAFALNRSVEEPLQRVARSLSKRLGLDRRPAPGAAPLLAPSSTEPQG